RGVSDIYYASSSDQGRSVSPNVRITDRGADRSLGAWKFDSKFNVGISSTEDTVYFAWQDPRNAILDSDAEDVYSASLVLDGRTADGPDSGGDGVPGWLLMGAGVLLGMGLASVLLWRMRAARS
ncbi:MAG TPA: hypothetical protein VGV86_07765, partial [Acidimicrobiales bacterium]|nr:hypothetical protein [Acidimicrobiales bacterium]